MAGTAAGNASGARAAAAGGIVPLAALGVAVDLAVTALAVVTARPSIVPPFEFGAIAAAFLATGAIAARRRPRNPTGARMAAVGYGIILVMVRGLPLAGGDAIARALLGLNEVLLAALLLSFPSGRLAPWPERATIRLIVGVFVTLAAVQLLTVDTASDRYCGGCAPNPFRLVTLPGAGTAATAVALAGSGVLGALVLAVLVRRWRRASGAARRGLAPVLFAGAVETFAVVTRALPLAATPAFLLARGAFLLELAVPIALLAAFLRARLDRSAVADLVLELGRAPEPAAMAVALRDALHDRGLRVFAWSPAAEAYVDEAGGRVALPEPGAGRAVTNLERAGRPLAVIVHDPALLDEPELIASAAAALGLAVDNQRLAATVRAQAGDARSLPRGTVTLLFCDLEGSTILLAHLKERYAQVLATYRQLVRQLAQRHGGREIDARADEFFAVFERAPAAVAAAVAVQRRMPTEAWPDDLPVRVRIGVHTGEPDLTDDGYVGLDVHRAARIGTVGHGGQVLLSEPARLAVGGDLPPGAGLRPLGAYQLRGLPTPEPLYQLLAPGLDTDFPPLRTAGPTAGNIGR